MRVVIYYRRKCITIKIFEIMNLKQMMGGKVFDSRRVSDSESFSRYYVYQDGDIVGEDMKYEEDAVDMAEDLVKNGAKNVEVEEHIYFTYEGTEDIDDADRKVIWMSGVGYVSDSRVSDDDDAFDEYFDYSEEAMEENDKVNDKCGGKRKVKDDNKSCQDLVDEINDWMNEETLTHVQVSDFLEMEGLVCEETAKLFGDNIEFWFYPNEPVGKYGKKGQGIEVDFNGYDELIDVVLVDRH